MEGLCAFLVEKFNNFRKRFQEHKIYELVYKDATLIQRAKLEAVMAKEFHGLELIRMFDKMFEVAVVNLSREINGEGQVVNSWILNENHWKATTEKYPGVLKEEDKVLLNRYIQVFFDTTAEIIKLLPKQEEIIKEHCDSAVDGGHSGTEAVLGGVSV